MEKQRVERLDDEIEAQFASLATLTPGSNEHAVATKDLVELYKLRMEEEKKADDLKQAFADLKSTYVKYGLEFGSFVMSMLSYRRWIKEGFKFEETGTFTSTVFRDMIRRFERSLKG